MAARSQRAEFATFFAAVTWLWFSAVFYLSLVVAGLGCDESCNGPGWRNTPDAWQYLGIATLGALAFVAGSAFVVFIRRRRPDSAVMAYVIGLAAAVCFATATRPDWIQVMDGSAGQVLFFATGLYAAPAALLLIAEPAERTDTQPRE